MKIRKQYLLLILPFCLSCKTYHMLDGNSSTVTFTADSSVFNDSAFLKPTIWYTDLLDIRGNYPNVIELKQNESVTAIINQPTFFYIGDKFLVYQGEKIIIKKGIYNDFTFEVEGNEQRNRELLFFVTYNSIKDRLLIPQVENADIDTILVFEKKLKVEIAANIITSQKLFDSLVNVYRVSDKFRKTAINFIGNPYPSVLLSLYQGYKDTLRAHKMFTKKCMELVATFNDITVKSKLNNDYVVLNELVEEILPVKIWRMSTTDEFQSCFDKIQETFNALSREYLLSQLMYNAYKKRITVPANYREKYETICVDKEYRTVLANVISLQQKNDEKADRISNNSLVSFNGRKVISLESLLDSYKGKVILIDFWASWCGPCIEEMPDLQKLMHEYANANIAFVSISLDREIQPWQKKIIAKGLQKERNYLLNDSHKSSFLQQYNIRTIPRYMLIDKEGKMINPDAPHPGDASLKQLVEKLLNP